ncbi:hypothetical protein V7S57_12600 [Caulobacter sp. CCNWLY153]|jgi:hypothetical protein|uniref:hypothetical protein n=1 Tax=Caulobacter TaxID=75 RepID=UPI000D5801C4|nr:hypothetical protein [Caulobacter radicis]PVM90486.1 hypothetical protein DDF62_09565 [Caulobacter radicis]
MSNIPFDTLSASKRLREAGMEARAAEAVVELVQQTTMLPDISDLATRSELLATKTELKSEIALTEARIRADLSEKIRLQGWALLGGMAVLVSISTALIKLLP